VHSCGRKPIEKKKVEPLLIETRATSQRTRRSTGSPIKPAPGDPPRSVTRGKENTMARAKVFIVNQEYKANYKVFFVDQPYKEKNAQIIAGGELVDQDYKADVKVFIVDQDYRADLKIMRKNFPR
jgi:hypothetical protein